MDKEEKDLSSKAEELKKLRKLLSDLWGVDPFPGAQGQRHHRGSGDRREIPATLKTPILYRPSAIAVITAKPDRSDTSWPMPAPGKSSPAAPALSLALKPNSELQRDSLVPPDRDTMPIPRPIDRNGREKSSG